MLRHLVLLALGPLTGAAPNVNVLDRGQLVHIQWHLDKITDERSLSIMDESRTNVLAHSCTAQIKKGSEIVSVDVDGDAVGSMTVEGNIYSVHTDLHHSGITCNSLYGADMSFFDCEIVLSSSTQLNLLEVAALENCFSRPGAGSLHGALEHIVTASGLVAARGVGGPELNKTAYEDGDLDSGLGVSSETLLGKRGGGCGMRAKTSELVGNGNPHQNWLHKQISENMDCGDGTCTVGWIQTTSFTITATLGAAFTWTSGGFNVQWSRATGNSYMAHTAYTVRAVETGACQRTWKSHPFIIWSPNRNNAGGGHYCVRGSYCRNLGDHYWDMAAHTPGGPP
ncbi:hypothetical protein CDD80_2863 [Ophiocordyceps camponoti-rufipedis]|uniref:Uncharacterized protein n=1 Tax=Ophiocordyceps camponoti-rufipedis TaxID=2004952 RepID=A0A2C5YYV8_9HYPO|nr:hypothetical protein CDD80_2863 [Ophiocordyceps camponoti-rufipedis]